MNRQIIINSTLGVAIIILALVAIFISNQANINSINYIDPDSKEVIENNINSTNKYNLRSSRIVISVNSSLFEKDKLLPNEYEVLTIALTNQCKKTLGCRYEKAAINTDSFNKNSNNISFEVRLGGPDSNDRRNVTINRKGKNVISFTLKKGNSTEINQDNVNIEETIKHNELRG